MAERYPSSEHALVRPWPTCRSRSSSKIGIGR